MPEQTTLQENKTPLVPIEALEDIPDFVGTDMVEYRALKKGEVRAYPEPTARLLLAKKLGKNPSEADLLTITITLTEKDSKFIREQAKNNGQTCEELIQDCIHNERNAYETRDDIAFEGEDE